MKNERGKVWLGAGAVVVNSDGKWLVVKKKYSGLKGVWSIPAGFVQYGETADEAALREVREETGIHCIVTGMVGFRTGVIRGEVSDNMAIFACRPINENQPIRIQEKELYDAKWLSVNELLTCGEASVMLQEMASDSLIRHQLSKNDGINPGDWFQYTSYRVFFNK
ncbi:NUDIX domain-containing protein [Ureibacillus thermophilus]|uniref:NUDIX hydrolase n=1 Tax=Ureibacillus thermophilus TaxID=367743 RepID=A0A4P6UTR4_9BACL|nr:NUDIX hydrolase [Ureibacillus thermophilus]QBK26613.1 NUDIX hydrolase [Ureibacillus thermophilus]